MLRYMVFCLRILLASSSVNLGQDRCLLSLLLRSDCLYGYGLSWVGYSIPCFFAIHLVLKCRSAADQTFVPWLWSTDSLVLIQVHFLVYTNLITMDHILSINCSCNCSCTLVSWFLHSRPFCSDFTQITLKSSVPGIFKAVASA